MPAMQPPPPTGTTTRSGSAFELIKHLDGDRALAGHGAQVVEGRHQRGAGAFDVGERGLGGQVVGRSAHDQLDELAAVVADAVTLLFRRLGRHIDAAVDAQRPACVGEALRVVPRRRADHARGQLIVRQLHQQVVGATQLVRAHHLQVFALEVDAGSGRRGQPVAELQRGGGDHPGNSLRRSFDVGR